MPQAPAVFKMAGVYIFILGDPVFRGAEYKKVKPKNYKISGNQTEVCIIPLL
jgi:hypothetical protein